MPLTRRSLLVGSLAAAALPVSATRSPPLRRGVSKDAADRLRRAAVATGERRLQSFGTRLERRARRVAAWQKQYLSPMISRLQRDRDYQRLADSIRQVEMTYRERLAGARGREADQLQQAWWAEVQRLTRAGRPSVEAAFRTGRRLDQLRRLAENRLLPELLDDGVAFDWDAWLAGHSFSQETAPDALPPVSTVVLEPPYDVFHEHEFVAVGLTTTTVYAGESGNLQVSAITIGLDNFAGEAWVGSYFTVPPGYKRLVARPDPRIVHRTGAIGVAGAAGASSELVIRALRTEGLDGDPVEEAWTESSSLAIGAWAAGHRVEADANPLRELVLPAHEDGGEYLVEVGLRGSSFVVAMFAGSTVWSNQAYQGSVTVPSITVKAFTHV